MSSAIFSFLGWSFLPEFCTGKLQDFWYTFAYRAGSPKPQPGTPLWVKHRRRIYFSVIVVYLLYTLYEADWNIRRAGDFYSDLGVLQDVSEKELNSRFRRITLQFHPDKLPPNLTPPQRQAAEARYIQLQLAKDTLLDPARRFAYDRLGADTTEWKHAKTIRDFVIIGGRRMIPFYIGSIIGMVGAQWFGVFDTSGTYWRYLTLLALLLFELRTITSASSLPITSLSTLLNRVHELLQRLHLIPLTTILSNVFATPRPPYLPFQSVQLAHRATITLFIALSRLAPLFTPPAPRGAATAEEAEIVGALQKLEGLVGAFAGDAARLLALEAVAFGEQPNASNNINTGGGALGYTQLLPHIKNFLVTNTVRQDPQVRAAMTAVLARKRGDGGDVLGDTGLQHLEDEAVREEEKTMEHLGWIASATSPGTSFLVDGDSTVDDEAADGEGKGKEEEETKATTNSSPQPSTSTQQTTQKTKNGTTQSPQIPLHTTTIYPRRNSKELPNPLTTANTEPLPLPQLDPGELADTEGETPVPPPTHSHTHNGHNHKHSHSHSHKIGGSAIMGASVELLGESEIREAKKEMEKVEGYEGDVDV